MNEFIQSYPARRGLETARPILSIVRDRGFIAGSYAAFMMSLNDTPIEPNDMDIFAKSDQAALDIKADLCLHLNFQAEVADVGIGWTITGYDLPIQVLKPHPKWTTFPDDILDAFDLDVCRAVCFATEWPWTPTLLADVNAGQRKGKVLCINNPERTLMRLVKYASRGVEFAAHEVYKVFRAWEQVTPERKAEVLAEAEAALAGGGGGATGEVDSGFWYAEDEYFRGERANDPPRYLDDDEYDDFDPDDDDEYEDEDEDDDLTINDDEDEDDEYTDVDDPEEDEDRESIGERGPIVYELESEIPF